MKYRFSERIQKVEKSFIREILKVITKPEIISFAGGLPHPSSFPVEEVSEAAQAVLAADGEKVLQYSTTEGYLPLREYIAKRYWEVSGVSVSAEEILITTGSQQAFDLIGKVFLEKGDQVLLEEPSYLGAIQSFSMYQPVFNTVELLEDGVNIEELEKGIKEHNPKLFYTVSNFQNPSGITYSNEKRKRIAELIKKTETILVEDDPYGELRFIGEHLSPIKKYAPEQVILLGSFSKVVSPGMRLGWICANKEIMEHLVTAKQATDLHTSFFSQRVMYEYLAKNDLSKHISKIQKLYKEQSTAMLQAIDSYFPKNVKVTRPEGGMFLWATLPEGYSAVDLFNLAIKRNVAFVPGNPFYTIQGPARTFRLNYTSSDNQTIDRGIKILAECIQELLSKK